MGLSEFESHVFHLLALHIQPDKLEAAIAASFGLTTPELQEIIAETLDPYYNRLGLAEQKRLREQRTVRHTTA